VANVQSWEISTSDRRELFVPRGSRAPASKIRLVRSGVGQSKHPSQHAFTSVQGRGRTCSRCRAIAHRVNQALRLQVGIGGADQRNLDLRKRCIWGMARILLSPQPLRKANDPRRSPGLERRGSFLFRAMGSGATVNREPGAWGCAESHASANSSHACSRIHPCWKSG